MEALGLKNTTTVLKGQQKDIFITKEGLTKVKALFFGTYLYAFSLSKIRFLLEPFLQFEIFLSCKPCTKNYANIKLLSQKVKPLSD